MAKKREPKEYSTNLDAVLAQIRKEFGEGAIMRMGDAKASENVPVISTGSFSLDLALGIGGVPRGRVIEVYGPESSGKTTLCSHIIANAQKAGGLAAFIDAEHAMDPGYAAKIGVNLDDLLVSQPGSGEEALTIAETLVRSGALDVVVIDSVAALTPRAELDGNMGDSHVGLQARLMSQALRKLTGGIATSKTTCIFTNQIREKIGVMFGSPETTPGGRALKFYASVRLDIRRIGAIKDATGRVMGNRTRVKVVKNKMAPPFTEAEFDILYAQGISWEGSVLDSALKLNLITKRGSWLSFEEVQIGQGSEAARRALQEDPKLLQRMVDKINAHVAEQS
ncbi:MAG: recombinase RecA [Verrucomicrobia bacterium]|jgi:recombination protein RecA|nr:recombinase RecA [Verrucomicrobiota bacterium]MBT7066621.1 recombinase RecA [Verrucomicrobiota bacterium]MBT7699753.1 recombinase RecA [Verrucomicrobiota bacterium]